MNNKYAVNKWLLLLVIAGLFLTGCSKDKTKDENKCTYSYRIYTPVYKSKAQVRASIKTTAPKNVSNPGKLFIRGSYIFLNEVNRGIHIIDNANPSLPKNIGFIEIPGNVDMAVKGSTLYADLYTDLVTLDISNPLQVVVKKITENAFAYRQYGYARDTSQFIVELRMKDTTITFQCDSRSNAESLASAASIGAQFGIGGSMARFTIVNTTLYTVSSVDLNAFSISEPENPVFKSKVPLGGGIETLYPFKDKLFIGSNSGMFIYDISNPEKPSRLGQFLHARACDPVIADDNYAFVTLRNGTQCNTFANQLDIVDIATLTSPALIKTYPMTNPHGLSKDGNTLFICDGKDGLRVYDASNVKDLKLLDHIKGFESYDVIAYNKLALVVSKDGLRQYDYSNLQNIRLSSKIGWEK